ncbi:MAG: hypothetical protein OEW15_17550 [Nitrospirota bacterium]|nr:hypothetical protein [Nitrospirota bacterium]
MAKKENDETTIDCPACHKPVLHEQIGKECPWCNVLIVVGKQRRVKWWVNKKHPGEP